VGGTRNPQAFDAFLRAEGPMPNLSAEALLQARVAGLTEAIRLDPGLLDVRTDFLVKGAEISGGGREAEFPVVAG
jgi:hypothetical protein